MNTNNKNSRITKFILLLYIASFTVNIHCQTPIGTIDDNN
ncbi:hypothetical protein SAMN04487979_106122 [Flavobacterium sp. ov086]|nr:hypothetical protein SAMN04487979_106122 [Flavobacterium sp. ov086]